MAFVVRYTCCGKLIIGMQGCMTPVGILLWPTMRRKMRFNASWSTNFSIYVLVITELAPELEQRICQTTPNQVHRK